MDNKQFMEPEERNKMDKHRQQLAEYIYQEAQKGNNLSSSSLYKAVSLELNNISDRGIEIILKQKEHRRVLIKASKT